jgi:ATP-dependent protease ClpP protease subunit
MENKKNKDESKNKEMVEDIKQLGTPNLGLDNKEIQCITIIGEIEGHMMSSPQKKTTKYEHIIPQLYAIEENPNIKGVLIILNTVGGDVEAGLAISELINSLSKHTATLVLGGSHSIGVPLATSGDYSFIAPTATMTIHPIRMNGTVIGVSETFEYFRKMQQRIIDFITRTSNIDKESLSKLMNSRDELVNDVGSVLIGKEAVEYNLINEVGGLKEAIHYLKNLIEEDKLEEKLDENSEENLQEKSNENLDENSQENK